MKKYAKFLTLFLFTFVFFLNSVSSTQTYLNESSQWGGNLSMGLYSSLAWGDLDDNGYTDLIMTKAGPLANTQFSLIYLNNGTTLTESSQWQENLTDVAYGSLSLGDIDNDGDLDLALSGCASGASYVSGCSGGAIITFIYINNGTTLTESSQWQNNLTAIRKASLVLGDIDNDGDLDLIISGRDGSSSKLTKAYINNGTSLVESAQWQQNLLNVDDSSLALADFDNDGDLDLSLTGCCDHHIIYKNNSYIHSRI